MQQWLLNLLTWQNLLRTIGLGLIVFLVLFREHPDTTVLLLLGAMVGLPTFLGLDKLGQGKVPDPPPSPPKDTP